MTKKIRLIDEPDADGTTTTEAAGGGIDNEQLMKYLEAIDWKMWEILKIIKAATGNK
jgi:hypothetical protein